MSGRWNFEGEPGLGDAPRTYVTPKPRQLGERVVGEDGVERIVLPPYSGPRLSIDNVRGAANGDYLRGDVTGGSVVR